MDVVKRVNKALVINAVESSQQEFCFPSPSRCLINDQTKQYQFSRRNEKTIEWFLGIFEGKKWRGEFNAFSNFKAKESRNFPQKGVFRS